MTLDEAEGVARIHVIDRLANDSIGIVSPREYTSKPGTL
jgi:hypothetical protein